MAGSISPHMSTSAARKKPVPIRTVREQIADRLRNEILASELAPEERLREVQLAERFGTSRGPIRDVLVQLTQEGALEYKPNSGVRVSVPPNGETRDFLMNLRRDIELHALERFIAEATDEDCAALEEILQSMRRACRDEDMAEIVGTDLALHRYIVQRGAGPELEAVWNSVAVRIRMIYSRHGKFQEIYEEHARIVEAIASGNLDAARQALDSNLV